MKESAKKFRPQNHHNFDFVLVARKSKSSVGFLCEIFFLFLFFLLLLLHIHFDSILDFPLIFNTFGTVYIFFPSQKRFVQHVAAHSLVQYFV